MEGFTPIRKKKISEEIVHHICNMVHDGDLQSGSKLPSEGTLAEKFGVSKTVVREAMSVLKTSGVIKGLPGSGNFINNLDGGLFVTSIAPALLDKESVLEIFELRRGLEIEAASLAADRATLEEIEELREINRKLSEAKILEETIEQDFRFHECLIKATHNSSFIKVFSTISTLFKNGIKENKMKSINIPGRQAEGVDEHNKIIESIQEKNSQQARKNMRNHLQNNELRTWNIDLKPNEKK
ncbi:FadR family transcriptional regulator [Alkalihalobacillus oceani]|uniref:FadR family transcriptional regulator n=1 Tax=Halalkalibacter oceani TaxID=1653776 RepID=A0A9X2DSB7_9BACI|nr:FadR/GntR family transcriptional regulator [Halalkalibacter oceani]MCM3714328.1 FadR family transcriptional regulator [Halalkalibacter oceani]